MNRVFYTLFKLWVGAVFILSMIIFYPLFFISLERKKFKTALSLVRFWGKTVYPIMGFYLKVYHHDRFPEPPYIICPNHSSYLDIMLMYRVIPHYFVFMGKQELEHWPVLKVFFTSGMNILVNRQNKMGSARAYKKAVEEIKKDHSIVVFPEGTIPADVPKLKEFKDGAFAIAIAQQIPIVPITFLDNYKMLKNGGFMKSPARPGIARAIIHDPVSTTGLTQADLVNLRQKVFDTIQEPLLK